MRPRSPNWYRGLGLVACLLVFPAFLGAGSALPITGAVTGVGQIATEQPEQFIRVREAAQVQKVLVAPGDAVAGGQAMVVLTSPELRAEAARLSRRLAELDIRRRGLLAERDGLAELALPPPEAGLIAFAEAEHRQFAERLALRQEMAAASELLADQITHRMAGLQAQRKALATERTLRQEALDAERALFQTGLTRRDTVRMAELALARLEGQDAALLASEAENRARLAELESARLGERAAEMAQINASLAAIAQEESKLGEALAENRRRQAALTLRAPVAGKVLALGLSGPGDVASPGQDLVTITPGSGALVARLRVPTASADLLFIGQSVRLVVRQASEAEPLELMGKVTALSPDAISQPGRGGYFELTASLPTPPHARLRPGQPVEAFLATGTRSLTHYLLQPLADIAARALRES